MTHAGAAMQLVRSECCPPLPHSSTDPFCHHSDLQFPALAPLSDKGASPYLEDRGIGTRRPEGISGDYHPTAHPRAHLPTHPPLLIPLLSRIPRPAPSQQVAELCGRVSDASLAAMRNDAPRWSPLPAADGPLIDPTINMASVLCGLYPDMR
eukprot:4020494-Pyramimonas_sp.AAC.1